MPRGMPRQVWATVYTDASHSARAAGIAFWAASRYGRIIKAEPILEPVPDSLIAELHAIHLGVVRTLQEWPELNALRITSDSKSALGFLRHKAKPKRSDIDSLVKATLGHNPDIYLKFVWVKGHLNHNTRSAYVNRQVDAMAREAMQKAKVLVGKGDA